MDRYNTNALAFFTISARNVAITKKCLFRIGEKGGGRHQLDWEWVCSGCQRLSKVDGVNWEL